MITGGDDKNMNDNDFLKTIHKEVEEERQKDLSLAKEEARKIGKKPFNLKELEKYWSYRYESKLSREEYLKDMKEYEEKYYLGGGRFMTMEAYGKYLMEMELYR